ncbi:DEAD/DEAH box helicase family protein [Pannus brasiliensis CCIBt3594]|uniref:DEAD/DEAH box helicase family protein n=1 Tax=Pannus brasiliensis CCIBt3594 TaxID=1427578 RepID=A0AAW9QWA0_9CHRO
MNLQTINLLEEYRSDRHDLIEDFYLPCLARSTLYCRAVGYFSSSSMVAVARGLTALIRGGGKMRLIASPHLSAEDIEAIATGLKQREEIVTNSLLLVLETEFEEIAGDRFACLAWLLGQGVLEIKLAIPKNIRNFGLYHEKLGLFADADGNSIAFTGSANESYSSLIDNFECIDVFRSWEAGEKQRAERKAENFDRLWHNKTENLDIIDFPEAAERSLLRFRPSSPPTEPRKPGRVKEAKSDYNFASPLKVNPKPRQIEAVNAWIAANYRGILAMATGSGKTITALAAASRIKNLELIVIGAPTREIVTQWIKELTYRTTYAFPVEAIGESRRWRELLFRKLRLINHNVLSSGRLPAIVVGTYGELTKAPIAGLIEDAGGLPRESLLIADEVHATGSGIFRRILREDFPYRLGLSATPLRAYDEEGTETVLDYFGGIVYEFGLEEAIKAGILCEYDYYVYVTSLDESEHDRFRQLTAKIRRGFAREDGERERINQLLIQRARIIKAAGSKLEVIDRIVRDHTLQQALIYCADIPQATAISSRLARRGLRVARYSSLESDRSELLDRLALGHLDALVAVKCLDEGVDIPAVSQGIILASDASPRQFIQRRGRILRAATNKEKATLIDVLVVPPVLDGQVKLIESEIQRVIEFARSAKNQASVITMLVEELRHYGITYSDLL